MKTEATVDWRLFAIHKVGNARRIYRRKEGTILVYRVDPKRLDPKTADD